MKTLLQHLAEKIKTSAWTIPATLATAAIVLAYFSLQADTVLEENAIRWFDWIERSSPEGARTLLATVATSMLAVAGVSFSSIMVTMTLASQQFGPRLLRNFIKDKFSQTVFGALIATFIYCILILRSIRTTGDLPFVPQVSTLIGLALALLCLALFIRFVHHFITIIQAERVVADAYKVLSGTISAVFPESDEADSDCRPEGVAIQGPAIVASKTGYIQALDVAGLLETATDHKVVLSVDHRAGNFISKDQTLVTVSAGYSPDDAKSTLEADVRAAFFIGPVRTPEQDYEFGIRQLVEVALRALSPGINDPFTAIDCIDYLGAGLQAAFARPLPPSLHRDREGATRLYTWKNSYPSLVEAAVNQIRQASYDRCDVSCRILEMLTATAKLSKTVDQQEALLQQATLVRQDTCPELRNDHDREAVESRFVVMREACHLLNHEGAAPA